jgi:hypothetical protein
MKTTILLRVGHQGVKKTMDLIKRSYFWKGMNKDIRDYVKTCLICQQTKVLRTLPYGLLEPAIPATRVFETILCDFMGPFPESGQGCQNKYLLVIVDELSRWVEVIPMRDATATKLEEALESRRSNIL